MEIQYLPHLAHTYWYIWLMLNKFIPWTTSQDVELFLACTYPPCLWRVEILEKRPRILSSFISDDIPQPVGASRTVLTLRTAEVDKLVHLCLLVIRRADKKKADGTWNRNFTLNHHFDNFFLGFLCNSLVRSLWRLLHQHFLLRLQKKLLQPVIQFKPQQCYSIITC